MSKLTAEEQLTRESYDKVAKLWERDHGTDKFWEEDFDRFFNLLPSASHLLEIGCGAGRDAQELITHGYEYVGTDISEGMVAQARANNPSAQFEQTSVYDLDFTEPFDGFWCAATLIHVPKVRINEALQSIKRNMKTKAVGFISMKEGIDGKLETRLELDAAKFLFAYWQKDEFGQVLARNGFTVLHEGYIPVSERTKWLTYIVSVQ